MELTDREFAVRWFDRKSTTEKEQEIEKAGLSIKIENLTDSDKEWIWRKQHWLIPNGLAFISSKYVNYIPNG